VRISIAAEESLEPQHVAVGLAPDDDGSDRGGLEQSHASQDECTHDTFAEIDLLDHQLTQPRRRDQQCIDVGGGDHVHERGRTGQSGEFPDERACTVLDELAVPEMLIVRLHPRCSGENHLQAR
jgi:hypothetical protein